MDPLDDILGTLDLRGALYFRTHFSGDWSVRVPELDRAARFHLVVSGKCHVTVAEGKKLVLGPGDLVMIPAGCSHALSSEALPCENGKSAPPELETVLQDAGYDGKGVLVVGKGNDRDATQMVCGHFTFRRGADHPFLQALPDHLLVTAADRAEQPWLDDCLRLIARRVLSGSLGSAAAAARLSEVLFIEVLNAHIGGGPLVGFMQAFNDPQIGKALAAVHDRPADAWTVDSLARHVGMSRSRFSDRFSHLIGVGPMAYIADWRLQKALAMLDGGGASVQEVASRSGYKSPAAFTRAFAAKFGVPPKAFRQVSA